MASTELDPLFVKGLRLLHSKNKDSTEQLKQLLDDVIAQSKQGSHPKDRLYTSAKLESDGKIHIKKASRDISEVSSFSSKYSSDDTRERKVEKRPPEKIKQEIESPEAKIPKLESPQVYPSYYPDVPSPDLPQLDQYVVRTMEDDTDSSDENADDFAMEMGLACVICKQIEVTQGNQLIECQECHSLYHQECHRPPATDYDYNDPRRVWYCAKCVKNMKKMATKTQKTAKSSTSISPKELMSPSKSSKPEGSPPALILPFKRTELKPTLSQGTAQPSANKPIGLAGLAANFGSGRSTTSSTTSLPSSTRGSKPTNSTAKTPFSTASSLKAPTASTTGLSSKMTTPSPFQSISMASASSVATTTQKTMTTATKGLGLLSAAVAATSRNVVAATAASGNGNSGSHKAPSFSPLMNADKRLQIMKKKASKMQEKRRLSTK